MTRLTMFLGFLFCVFGLAIMAAAQTPAARSTPDVTGKWTLSIDTPIGEQLSTMDLQVDAGKISGSSTRQDNQLSNKVTGELTDKGVSFTMTWMGPVGEVGLAFTGKIAADGSMAGTASLDGGDPVSWSARRPK